MNKRSQSRTLWLEGVDRSESGRSDAAIKLFCSAIATDPGWGIPYFWRAMEFEELDRLDEAIMDYSTFIDVSSPPTGEYAMRLLAEALAGRANCRLMQDDVVGSVEDWSSAIRHNPSEAVFYLDRSIALHRLGEHARSAADYQLAIEMDPGVVELADGKPLHLMEPGD